MAGQTVSAHLDEDLAAHLRATVRNENRPASQFMGVALKGFLGLAPGSRQMLFSADGACSDDEKAFIARSLSRQVLKSYQAVLENRYMAANRDAGSVAGSNSASETEDDIEHEAVRACRQT